MGDNNQYYLKEKSVVLDFFRSSENGLSFSQVKKRLLEKGYNELPEAHQDSYFSIFFQQFKSPLIYILLAAGIAVFSMGEIIDAAIVFFVLFFNATVGAIQEGKAQSTFLALKKFIKGRASVLRNGEELAISDREIVPGDIIILREGEKVPADARIIAANSLKLNEMALTGESIPKFKTAETLKKEKLPIMDRINMVYKGTTIVSGMGRAVVTATGLETFLGSIAKETLAIDSEFPLKKDIEKLSHFVIIFVSALSLVLFILGILNNYLVIDIFKTIVAISVSIIPEGLPIIITLVLAGGVWRMGKKNVLVKKLQAVEVLGEIKILAVDKTGTVTKNELVVEEVYSNNIFFKIDGDGYVPEGGVYLSGAIVDPLNHPEILFAGKIAALNSSATPIFEKKKNLWRIAGDPTEGSLAVFSKKVGFQRDELLSETPLLDEIPFDYELKFHASLHKQKKNNILAVTGSPEVILKLAQKNLTTKEKKELLSIMQSMSRKGLRVIGFASGLTTDQKLDRKNIPDLIFGGFFGIKDELREEVREAVRQVTAAGIKVVMITGDNEITAKAIAKEAGIAGTGEILSGDKLEKMDRRTLAKKVQKISVFARITPDQKLKIIKAYQLNGTIIAMTGDGVNDALSLTSANIGIGMGKIGTEVAKEAADIILLDDNFGSIIHGVEEGRNIFNTIKRVILYLFSTSLGEVMVILGALLLGLPLPLLAAQILWLNLVTDGFLDLALAMEPKRGNLANTNGRKNALINKTMIERMFLMALPMALGTLYLFSQNYQLNIEKAWTISLTVMAAFQWFNAWNCRSEKKSLFSLDPFSNKFLLGATFIVITLQFLAIYNSFFQKILQTVPLEASDWLTIILIASSILVVEEIRKFIRRSQNDIAPKIGSLVSD